MNYEPISVMITNNRSHGRKASRRRLDTQPLHLRIVAWIVIWTQATMPIVGAPGIEIRSEQLPLASISTTRQVSSGAPSPNGREFAPNRTIPNVAPPSSTPLFSDPPTDEEILHARIFEGSLIPLGSTSPGENKALAAAIKTFRVRSVRDDFSALVNFLENNPHSVWRPSLLLNLGTTFRKTGYFTKALAVWQEAWEFTKTRTEPAATTTANLALAELLDLNASLGRFDLLEKLLQETEGRDIRGSATEKVTGAKEGLWSMRNRPEESFRCGPFALERICALVMPGGFSHEKIDACKSTTNGIPLSAVRSLARDLGLNYVTASRKPGADIILPALIHWRQDHYAAVIKKENDLYLIQDPTFGSDIWVSQRAIDTEGSGAFLIPSQKLPQGWSPLTESDAAQISGKGSTSSSDKNRTKPCDKKVACQGCGGGPLPMAQYGFHAMVVSLNIFDTPVGYVPPRGPAIHFTLTYNQREANQPDTFPYSNLGNKWTYNWLAYIKDDPTVPNGNKEYYVAGGGTEIYYYDSGTGLFKTKSEDRSDLGRTTSAIYERRLPDGSKQIFDLSDGNTGAGRKIFLTKIVDPSSNTVTLTYDGSFRLVSIQDAIGLVTTNSYDFAGDTRKITKVTDPFGRYATFDYNIDGQLIRITDVAGITSEFTYGTGDFITSLTTPYGTTTFAKGETGTGAGRIRWIEAVDPLGQKERLEYDDGPKSGVPSSETPLPSGYYASAFEYRNSYYWDKNSIQYTNVYTNAYIMHWLKGANGSSGLLENEKKPLERRIFYSYPGQTAGALQSEGTNGLVSSMARVLDDGSTQKYQYEYNALGRITKFTDPTNRVALFTYSTNLVDLLEIRQQVGSTNQLLSSFTYNAQHLPVITVDAAGQTNYSGYNTNGQLTSLTNALGQTTMLSYNINGYLTNVTGAVSNAITSFAFDATNRVRTITDSEGYIVTFDYDVLNRPMKITYPDNTFDQILYKWLDPVLFKDRRGHWTQSVYDPLRRITDIQDGLNRVTHFEWCSCGALASMTDGLGQMTSWERDLQGRPTAKVYNDLTRVGYSYDLAGRIKSTTDAKNQTTWNDYYVDNNLKRVTYSNAVVATPSVEFTYHSNYNRLVSMVDGIGTNTYSYYVVSNTVLGAGRLESIDGPLTNDTISYTYDELGRVKSQAIDGVAEGVTYDSLGRVTSLTNVLGMFTNFYVNNTLRLASNSYPNGQQASFTYYGSTNDQRLQTIWHQKSDGSTISKFDYTYHADGRIATWTQQADSGTPKTWVIEYDPVDQLLATTIRSNGIAGAILNRHVYAYDNAGNRTGEQKDLGVSAAMHNTLNQLTSIGTSAGSVRFRGSLNEIGNVTVGGASASFDTRTSNFVGFASTSTGSNLVPVVATDYSNNRATNRYGIILTNNGVTTTLQYDLNGNLTNSHTSTKTNSYEWDAADRLTAIEVREIGQVTRRTEFAYDGSARRARIIEKTNGVVQTESRFLWRGLEICEKRDGTGAIINRRYFGGGERISTASYFYARDHLGSVREMLNDSQTIEARYDYDPYGRRTALINNIEPDFSYTGHFYHSSSALHLATFRGLDSGMGRWLSRDPIEESAGPNIYAYVDNDVVNKSDPLGLWAYFQPSTWFDGRGYQPGAWESFNGQVAQAILDGIIPFWDPFKDNGGYDPCDKALEWSRRLAALSRDIYTGRLFAGLFGAGTRAALWSGSAARTSVAQVFPEAVTLSQTLGGRLVANVIAPITTKIFGRAFTYHVVWRAASALYAANAKGIIPAVIEGAPGASKIIWTELWAIRVFGNARPVVLYVP